MDAFSIISEVFSNWQSEIMVIAAVGIGIGVVKLLLNVGWNLYHQFLYSTGRGRGSD